MTITIGSEGVSHICPKCGKPILGFQVDLSPEDCCRCVEEIGEPMKGWICPKCGSVYSPFVTECERCKNSDSR
jgi:hypothetical protein